MTTKRHIFAGSVLLLGALLLWWGATDQRVNWWPQRVQHIYAQGAMFEYLRVRCIAPSSIEYVGIDEIPQVQETYVGAYTTEARYFITWRISDGEVSYPVMVSVFPDAEFAVAWWYDVRDPSKQDIYISSSKWGEPWATTREPVSRDVLKASKMSRSSACVEPL